MLTSRNYRTIFTVFTHLNLTTVCACAAEVERDVINEPHYTSGASGDNIVTNYRHQLPQKYGKFY